MKLTPKTSGESLFTELKHFARQKTFYARAQGEITVAKLRPIKVEDVPEGFDPIFCFLLEIKGQAFDFLQLLGLVFLVLHRFR